MRSLFDPLTERLHVRWRVEVSRLSREKAGWFLLSEAGGRHGPYDAVIVTAPAPQAARLIDGAQPELSGRLAGISMQSVWTGMVTFARPVRLPERGDGSQVLPCGGDETSLSRSWVVHMGPEWTDAHLENDAPFAAALMREEIERDAGERLPPTEYLSAHRWRFARVREPLGQPCLACEETRLWAGGDWALGRTAQDAWASGRAMAEAITERMPVA
jgi:predicted NAD/FAD-dependent oxidoreductase